MRYKRKHRVRLFSIVATFLMVFSLMTPAFAATGVNESNNHVGLFDTKTNAKDKVSDRLLSEFKKDDKVRFLVKFKEKTDVAKVAEEARQKANLSKLSADQTQFLQRSTIISELKTTSFESHENVIQYLEDEMDKGAVEDYHSYFIVNGMAVTATREVAEKIATFAEVEKILPNEKRQLQETFRTDEETPQSNTENVEWNIERIGAPLAWDMGIDGTGTVVASLDTGTQWDHPALKEKYRGYNAETGEVDHTYSFFDAAQPEKVEAYDDHGHGTHVTGTMVGSEPDESNQIGVAPGAKWLAVKVFDGNGNTSDDILLAGAEWILAPGGRIDLAPDVVNNSWGGGPGLDEWYRDAVTTWREYGIFPEVSAGNITDHNPGGPGSIAVPANYPESFSTGAVDVNDKVAMFSLRGPSPYGEIKPEVSAPGVNIRSSVPGSEYEGGWNGTSFAGPAVSAVAAMLRQVDANITVDKMEEILLLTADPLVDANYPETPNNGYGWGMVNAYDAVAFIKDGVGSVSGTVTQPGVDEQAPTFEHTPITEISSNVNIDLTINVQDNIAVTSVQLSYEVDEGETKVLEAERISGDYRDGEYYAQIPSEDVEGEMLAYKWIINDYGNNTVESDVYEITIKSGISTGYYEDFENKPAEWYSFGLNDVWEWGVPTSGPGSAFTGDHVYATNLSGTYPKDLDATLVMPPIDLPEGQSYLQFTHWYQFEYIVRAFGFGYVVISKDLENWERLETFTDKSNGWLTSEIDLSDYSGERVYIGFNSFSNGVVVQPGWYIDNVALTDTPQNQASVVKEEPTPIAISMPNKYEAMADEDDHPRGLPVQAQVTSLESGRSVNTSLEDGSFLMTHPAGAFNMQASAYGYYPHTKTVEISHEDNVDVHFTLNKIPLATINGTITDSITGDPITKAKIMLVEDANIEPIETDEEGNFSLTAYEGEYNVRVMARNYHSKTVEITLDGDIEENVALDPHYTYPGDEIGYDDGTPENARLFYEAGNGWAVKMSLPEEKDSAVVTDGVFRFWNTDFPNPGGEDFQIEVWDATGKDGLPGEKLAGPIDATALRTGEWTVVDLREHNIVVEDDFYMVYIQTDPNPFAPAIGVDETGEYSNRNYEMIQGFWSPADKDLGNFMIRARVDYSVEAPIITSPSDGLLTGDTGITIDGLASPTTTVKLTNNGDEIASSVIEDDGKFSFPLELIEGENNLVATTYADGFEVDTSEPVVITLDTIAPEITITHPLEGEETNRETVTVEGIAEDIHLDYVEVNGKRAELDGSYFSKRVIVDEGENVITVVAYDKVGNVSEKSVTIFTEYEFNDQPKIFDVSPATNKTVFPGDEVEISFTSNVKGGESVYQIHLPFDQGLQSVSGHAMVETEPGVYQGTWTVPTDFNIDSVNIQVAITDQSGNTAVKEANGKLFISTERTDRISGTTRFDTAVEVSKSGWDSADTVVLARSDDYADALAGVPLAHQLDAPILLTRSGSLVDATRAEIERLGAEKVIILGGTVAISETVSEALEGMGVEVERVLGTNRYETSVAIAEKMAPEGVAKAIVANGRDFPDALSVASQAAIHGMPILLTRAESLPEATNEALTNLGVSETLIVGGTLAVSDSILDQLPGAERVRGSDRIGTNIAVQEHFGVTNEHLYVATGNDYADALTGAVLAAKNNSSILLVRNSLAEETAQFIEQNNVRQLTLFGGTTAIGDEIKHDLKQLLK